MRLRALLFGALIACSGTPRTSAGGGGAPETPKATTPSYDRDHIARELDRYLGDIGKGWGEGYQFSGYLHLQSGDQVLYSKGFGLADRKASKPHRASTSFRTGSVTKQFTAAAIMLLVQDGKLELTDTIRTHLPDYPAPAGDRVTVHQLLNHTSGIPSYTSSEAFLERRDERHSVAELMALFQDAALEFEPGTEWRYNNSGYVILGAIIEKLSGQSYGEFLARRLFGPAGMTRTVVGDAAGDPDRAVGYRTDPSGAVIEAHPIDMTVPYAAGAVRSTAEDLVRWDRWLRDGEILTLETQRKMWNTEPISRKQGSGYGYGWLITRTNDTFVHHGGGIDGFATYYLRGLDSNLALVVYANNPAIDVGPIKEVAVMVAFGGAAPAHTAKPPAALDDAETAKIVGTYVLTPESRDKVVKAGAPEAAIKTFESMVVRREGKGLVIDPVGQEPTAIHRKAPNVYEARQVSATIEFRYEAAQDVVTSMELTQGGVSLVFARAATPKPAAP